MLVSPKVMKHYGYRDEQKKYFTTMKNQMASNTLTTPEQSLLSSAKDDWNDLSEVERPIDKNTVMLVAVLYDMCKVQMEKLNGSCHRFTVSG